MTLALGLVTPPYGLWLLIAVVILILTALLPGIVIGFPRLLDPDMFP